MAEQGDGPDPVAAPSRRLAGKVRESSATVAARVAATFGSRGDTWLPHILSGVLGGAVVFLLLKEVDERRKRRWRRNNPPRD